MPNVTGMEGKSSTTDEAARARLADLIRELAPATAPPWARPARAAPDETATPDETEAEPEPGETGNGGHPGLPISRAPHWAHRRAGRLVEHWLPGGVRAAEGVRGFVARHRFGVAAGALALVAAVVTLVAVVGGRPPAEAAPPLPAAVGVVAATVPAAPTSVAPTSTTPSSLVVSVVGRVTDPGLVTVPNGSRVADALRAAGGMQPGADLGPLNLARRLADGEQLYVGVPVPAGADGPTTGQPQATDQAPPPAGGGGKAGLGPGQKVNLNTATAQELQALPGVGPTMAQRILTWRGQHGHFDSINQLRQVGGIGPARYAKIQNLVTT